MKPANILIAVTAALVLAGCGSPEERAADYIERAQALFDEGDYLKARLEAQNAAQVEPKNARARYLLAQIAEENKEYQQMFGHLLVAVDGDPANVEARLKLATLYFLGQAWDEAATQTDELLKLAPDDARVRILHARVLIQRGERQAGLDEIQAALKLDPDNVDAILLQAASDAVESLDKGLVTIDTAIERLPPEKARPLRELKIVMLAQSKRMEEVEQGLRSLSDDFPKEQAYQFQLAQFYTSQGRVDDADALLKRVTELDPKDADTQLGYVQFLASQRDAERAEAALKAFVEENPESDKLRLALGELYEITERPELARGAYVDLETRSPKSPEGLTARNRIAAIDVRAGKLDEASAMIDRILEDAPDDAPALLLRSGLRFTDGQFGDAIGDLRLVLRKEPENARALLLMAQAYVSTNDLVLAKDTYRRLLEVAPESPEGLQQLAMLYVSSKEFAEAETLLRRHLEKQPADILASGRLVEVLMAQDKSAGAEEEARRMIALANQSGVGDFSLGRVMAQKQDYNAAAEAFRKSVAARRDDPLPLEGLVRSLLAAGKQGEAINVLNQQLDANQNELFSKFLLGGIYGVQGDQANASKYLEEVLQDKPDSVVAWASLAGLYPKDRDARIRVYERGLKAVPASGELTMLLATEYEQARRVEDAIALYENLLKVTPDYLPAVNNLAALLLDERSDRASHDRALQLARALSNMDNPAMLDTLGWAHYRAGEYQEAIGVLERVVAKAGGFPVFRYHLGMAYLAAGNPVSARQELAKAVDTEGTYPGKDEAVAALQKLNSDQS